MFRELGNLVIQLLISLLVWSHYRDKVYPVRERYSTFAPRFWSPSIDSCVIWPVTFLLSWILARELPTTLRLALFLLQETLWMAYTVTMHTKFGQTYGKMICKVRVVDFESERPITFRQALLREGIPIAITSVVIVYQIFLWRAAEQNPAQLARSGMFWLISSLPALWFLAEVVTMLMNEKRRALHDLIAGTIVIRTNLAARTNEPSGPLQATR